MVPWSESPSSTRNSDEEEPGDPEDDKNLLGLPRNWKGLTMVPKKMKRKILEKGLRDFSTEEGEEEEDDSLRDKLYMHICIFLVGDGTFVSFGLRQRKKTPLKGMWEREIGEEEDERDEGERKKNQRRTCGGRGGVREKKIIFFKKS
jgi:hypothetical protein